MSSPVNNKRLRFIDNIRIFLTVLVVAHHAGQAYGPTGGRWLIFNPERADLLGTFFAVNAAFFMGLFFFVAGYFTPGSYDRKGAKAFLRERFLRLGLPIALFALLIFPLVFYVLEPRAVPFAQFWWQEYLSQAQLEFGHLWFLLHLLVYALGYALWRQVIRPPRHRPPKRFAVPNHQAIWIYLVALAVVTFIVRIWYPIDTWRPLFGLIPTEIAHLPQYLSLFILGLLSYRGDWLRRMPQRRGFIWLSIGLGSALLRYGYGLSRSVLFPTPILAGGGWDWRSLLWSTWEAAICVGLCVGLLALFREWGDRQGPLPQWLAANAYTVYLIHILIVIGLQFLVAGLSVGPWLKFAIVTLVSVPLCFLLSHSIRKLPFAQTIL